MNVNRILSRLIKSLFMAWVISNLMACKNDLDHAVSAPQLTSLEHDQALLKAKQAILDLDLSQLDTLTANIDVNRPLADQSTLLAWAVETQDPRLVRRLLRKGAMAQTAGGNRFTPIILACRYGNSAIINALLDHGADPSSAIEDGTSAFQLCAASAPVDDLARMVSLGATVSAENDYGQTALMFAANAGNTDNLEYLVTAGANINKQTQQGYSPLFFAIKSHNVNTIKMAIAHGADVFATAQDGTSAAQLGVYTMNYEFLSWFVSELDSLMPRAAMEATLTAFDRNGDQLLHAAVKANQPELVSALLKQGADPATVSEQTKLTWRYEANFKTENYTPPRLTPMEIAQQNGFKTITALLHNATNGALHGT